MKYLVYRIKDNGRFAPDLLVGGLYDSLAEAELACKRNQYIKRIKVSQ